MNRQTDHSATPKVPTLKYLMVCCVLPMLAAALAILWGSACTPDIAEDPSPEIMEFDPTAGRAPEPTILVINQQTGLIDMSIAGIILPPDCSVLDATEVAQCEFYQYLETLDGFPTLSGLKAPSSAPLDLATVTLPDNMLIMTATGRRVQEAEVFKSYDEEQMALKVDPLGGWDVGQKYIIAVRGYDDGVKTVDGTRVVASVTYLMLKQIESLVCDAPSPAEIDPHCKYYELLLEQLGDPNEAAESLWTLELIRAGFEAEGAWDAAELFGDMPREEVAILWAFPTHTGTVFELNPELGMVPEVNTQTNRELRVSAKGTVDASSIITSAQNPNNASVYLLNLTALEQGNIVQGLPTFTCTWEEPDLVLTTQDPMIDGALYAVILTTGLTNEDGDPIVPSPLTVFLRTRGTLVDAEGHSTLSQIDDAQAAQAEVGRSQLAALLDDPMFGMLTGGLEREEISYMYAFSYPDPMTTD